MIWRLDTGWAMVDLDEAAARAALRERDPVVMVLTAPREPPIASARVGAMALEIHKTRHASYVVIHASASSHGVDLGVDQVGVIAEVWSLPQAWESAEAVLTRYVAAVGVTPYVAVVRGRRPASPLPAVWGLQHLGDPPAPRPRVRSTARPPRARGSKKARP